MKFNIIKKGKTKSIFSLSDTTAIMKFSDLLVDNLNARKVNIAGKGKINARMTVYLFKKLEEKKIKTHLVGKATSAALKIRLLKMIPLEVVLRRFAYGSFYKRYGIAKGLPFSNPLVEFFLKDDLLDDPLISPSAITGLGILKKQQVFAVEAQALKIWSIVSIEFLKVNIELIDIKLEFGMIGDEIYLGDEIGFDTLRIRDKDTLAQLDKDVWYSQLPGVEAHLSELKERIQKWT